jgi:hypothetical protein
MTPKQHYESLLIEKHKQNFPITASTTPNRYWPNALEMPKISKATHIEKCIKEFVEMLGHQCSKITTSGTFVKGTKTVGITTSLGTTTSGGGGKYIPGGSTKGVADLIITVYGLKLDCEIKYSKGDKQRKTQAAYQTAVEKAGGFYMIATSFDDFYRQFHDFLELPQVKLMQEFNNK